MLKRVVQMVVGAVVLFALVTWWALESDGVAILQTKMQSGAIRSTHVWFVERGGELWIEAGSPSNAWYRDIQEEPAISFSNPDTSQEIQVRALPDPDGAAHDRIRSELRAKYGLRDWWIGHLIDASRSVAVRLVPANTRGDRDQ
jgi:hypothetical protein